MTNLERRAKYFLDMVFGDIKHGDDDHQAWLKGKLNDFHPTLVMVLEAVEKDTENSRLNKLAPQSTKPSQIVQRVIAEDDSGEPVVILYSEKDDASRGITDLMLAGFEIRSHDTCLVDRAQAGILIHYRSGYTVQPSNLTDQLYPIPTITPVNSIW